VKKAKGNSGRRPIATAEIEEEAYKAAEEAVETQVGMQPPDWISDDGRTVWNQLAPRLAAMQILKQIDSLTFGRYCEDFGLWVKLKTIVGEEGSFYESESAHGKFKRPHPAFNQAKELDSKLMQHEANFALNPADRQRLFAARAAAGQGGLFPPEPPAAGDGDGLGKGGSPIGMLN
jgi:P27 family predicted phage terminase small subunit